MKTVKSNIKTACAILAFSLFAYAMPLNAADMKAGFMELMDMGTGERIAAWAEKFVGTPYDADPMGLYVTTRRIVADESVDCMYHVFRSVELGLSSSEAEAVEMALSLRFQSMGKLGPDGLVSNYDERYEYGYDMVRSGKWGRDVTAELGRAERIKGERGVEFIHMLPPAEAAGAKYKSGDIVYFVKKPEKRVVGEVVGHMGIVSVKQGKPYLIHASGLKKKGGQVVMLPLAEYLSSMPFVGIVVTRLEGQSHRPR